MPTAKSLDESLLVEAGASYCRADGIPVQPARIPYASHKAIYHLLGTPTIPLPDHELSVAELEHSSELLADELADSYGSYAPYEVSTEEVSGDVGKNGKNVVRADGEPGKNPVRTRDVLTEEVRISEFDV
jgi:hypothetical protein